MGIKIKKPPGVGSKDDQQVQIKLKSSPETSIFLWSIKGGGEDPLVKKTTFS